MKMERGARIGRGTVIAVPDTYIGEDANIDDRVWVSASYPRPGSSFELGGFSILMRDSYVNCSLAVSIGEGSGIGGHCLIFTHGYWLSWFDGYPRQLSPVSIGRDVWLPWRVFVMPGTTICDGSVIAANSTVSGHIPPFSLAAGSPATVMKTFPGKLPYHEQWKRLQVAIDDMLSVLRHAGLRVDGSQVFDNDGCRGAIRLIAPGEMPPQPEMLSKGDTVISLERLSDLWRIAADSAGIPWFDLTTKERSDRQNSLGIEVVHFLSGYGVRFHRC